MAAESTRFIIVGLKSGQSKTLLGTGKDLRTWATEAGATDLIALLEEYSEVRTERLIYSVPAGRILELEKTAADKHYQPQRSLAAYWRVDARTIDNHEELVRRFSQIQSIDLAYLEMRGSDPLVDPVDDLFAVQQLHLDPAPVGINARWAWTQPEGSGALVGFVDMEQGWNLMHEDLPVIAPLAGVPQDVNPASSNHGTGVMGIAAGVDNAVGIIGVAPTPAWVSIASHFRASDGTNGHVANAITAVMTSGGLAEGDVLLIEYQDWFNRPAEMEPPVRTAIDLATSLGMIVIEAAGNGNVDLDTVPELNRENPTFSDSCAVIVGAALSALDNAGAAHDRWVHPFAPAGSNFGSRVDCYAYGDSVVTTGQGGLGGVLGGTGPNDQYRSDFGGTSAAAAIVAGAAVVLQSMHKKVTGGPLTPLQMRNALSTYGTPQGLGQPGHIGVMPDLKKAAKALKLVKKPPAPPTNVRITRRPRRPKPPR